MGGQGASTDVPSKTYDLNETSGNPEVLSYFKKKNSLPLNPGWLIVIPIMVYYNPEI